MKIRVILVAVCLFLLQNGYSQEQEQQAQPEQPQETQQQDTQTEEGESVIDLTITITPGMELPQVQIFDKRITPDFKNVSAEKSFFNEISQVEQIQYDPITSGRVKPIKDIEALLKKKRF